MSKKGFKTFSNISIKRTHGEEAQEVVLKLKSYFFSHMIQKGEYEGPCLPTRRTTRVTRKSSWVLPKTKQGCIRQRALKECVSCQTHSNPFYLHGMVTTKPSHRWVSLDSGSPGSSTKREDWCCFWCILPDSNQRCWTSEPGCRHNTPVQEPGRGTPYQTVEEIPL